MNGKRTCLILLILILIGNALFAQSRPFPYEISKKDFVILPLGIGLSFFGDSLSKNYDPITVEEIRVLDRKDVNAFDRPATYNWALEWEERSDSYRDIVVISTLFTLSVPPLLHTRLSNTLTVAVMFIESYFFLKGITYITKSASGRKRPYLYNTDLSVEERQGISSDNAFFSFYSGHTAAAFTAATFVSKVFTDIHGKSVWSTLLWGSSLSLAALAGYSRFKCGQHFPTDVIVGAAVGFSIGYLIPAIHRKKLGDSLSVMISPNQISLCLKY